MKVNNEVYEKYGSHWWREDAGFDHASLRFCVNPVRWDYFRRKLQELEPGTKSVLDVGCGGGYLSEEFARAGHRVTGLDPAASGLQAAREHAAQSGLPINYLVGRGEQLPFEAESFDIVACCDVLEHVDDVGTVIGEVSRVLKPKGVFFFDTVNRTVRSYFAVIKVLQDWGVFGLPEPNMHVWDKFLKPRELVEILNAHHLQSLDLRGISARHNPLRLLPGLLSLRKGKVRGAAVAEVLPMRESGDLSVSYMGYARKKL